MHGSGLFSIRKANGTEKGFFSSVHNAVISEVDVLKSTPFASFPHQTEHEEVNFIEGNARTEKRMCWHRRTSVIDVGVLMLSRPFRRTSSLSIRLS